MILNDIICKWGGKSAVNYKTKTFALKLLPKPLRRVVVLRRYRMEIEETGEAELPELRKFVANGDLALDIGSNLGVYAYELHRLSGRVMAFEPNPTLAAFIKSVAPVGLTVLQVALSSENGEAELAIPLDSERGHGWASVRPNFLDGPLERVRVPARRLDDLKLPPVRFIKIDVEGFEQQVIDGGWETVSRDLPFLLIEIDEVELHAMIKKLAPLGYQAAFFHEGVWRPISEFDPGRLQSMELWHGMMKSSPTRRELVFINNFLFLPPTREIAEFNL